VLLRIQSRMHRKHSLLRKLVMLSLSIAIGMALLGTTIKTVAAKGNAQVAVGQPITRLTSVSMIPSSGSDSSSIEGWMVGATIVNRNYQALYLHYQAHHWSQVTTDVPECSCLLTAISMANHNSGWIFGTQNLSSDPALVFMKYDRGRWSIVTPPFFFKGFSMNMSIVSPEEFWAMALDTSMSTVEMIHYKNGNWTMFPIDGSKYGPGCLGTTDQGDAWISAKRTMVSGTGKNTAFPTASILHIVGESIVGQPWNDISGMACNALQMHTATDGWAIGASDVILGSSASLLYHFDGTHWIHIPNATRSASIFQLLSVVGANDVWMEGIHLLPGPTPGSSIPINFFAHFLNGTTTFVDIPSSDKDKIESLSMANTDEGWAVGENIDGIGIMYHFSNGTWIATTYNDMR
jgi:hypothetical protein